MMLSLFDEWLGAHLTLVMQMSNANSLNVAVSLCTIQRFHQRIEALLALYLKNECLRIGSFVP